MTADYVISAILVPYCARAACHSASSAAHGLAFDTIANAKAAFGKTIERKGMRLPMVTANDPGNSRIYTVLSDSSRPMPPDAPIPDADRDLIKAWIENNAAGYP
jgi:hypothetical protein